MVQICSTCYEKHSSRAEGGQNATTGSVGTAATGEKVFINYFFHVILKLFSFSFRNTHADSLLLFIAYKAVPTYNSINVLIVLLMRLLLFAFLFLFVFCFFFF